MKSRPRQIGIYALLNIILYLSASCSLGPVYTRPTLALPQSTSSTHPQYTPYITPEWWKIFGDPQLNAIEEEALLYNNDLLLACARVEEAQALAQTTHSQQLPQINMDAGAEKISSTQGQQISEHLKSRQHDRWQLSGFLSYEIDVWGKLHKMDEVAQAELLNTEYGRESVRLRLTADVASAYCLIRASEARCAILKSMHETYQKTCSLYEKRFNSGQYPELALRRVQAERANTEALLKEEENTLSQAQSVLMVLLGRNPRAIMEDTLAQGKSQDQLIKQLPTPQNAPSDLLQRRPDIHQSEQQLIADNARIGVARANYYPSISLTSKLGTSSLDLENLFSGKKNFIQGGTLLSEPLFTGGQLTAQEEASKAVYKQMLIHYSQTIQQAFREVRDALVEMRKSQERAKASHEAVKYLARSLDLATKQYSIGYIEIMDMLDVQRSLLHAQLNEVAARQMQLNAIVHLSKSLGGGWKTNT